MKWIGKTNTNPVWLRRNRKNLIDYNVNSSKRRVPGSEVTSSRNWETCSPTCGLSREKQSISSPCKTRAGRTSSIQMPRSSARTRLMHRSLPKTSVALAVNNSSNNSGKIPKPPVREETHSKRTTEPTWNALETTPTESSRRT